MTDRKHIQALHAAISQRSWHDAEVAANAISDAQDAVDYAPSPSEQISGEAVERGWQPIETAPHACHFLATYWSDDFCEWAVSVVMLPLSGPWTHWMPLPSPPELKL